MKYVYLLLLALVIALTLGMANYFQINPMNVNCSKPLGQITMAVRDLQQRIEMLNKRVGYLETWSKDNLDGVASDILSPSDVLANQPRFDGKEITVSGTVTMQPLPLSNSEITQLPAAGYAFSTKEGNIYIIGETGGLNTNLSSNMFEVRGTYSAAGSYLRVAVGCVGCITKIKPSTTYQCKPTFQVNYGPELTASEAYSQQCFDQTSRSACEQVDIYDARSQSFGTADGTPDCRWTASEID